MSDPPAPRTLWRDEARRRFYLVPDAVAPEPGALVLRAGAARRIEVGEASVAPYEVTKDEARAFLDARLDGFVGGVKRSVEDALSRLGIPIPGSAAKPDPATSSPDAATAASAASPASGDSGDVSPRAASSADAGPAGDGMRGDAPSVDVRSSTSGEDGTMVDQPADVSRNAMPGRKSSDGEVTGDRPREASSGARATGDRSVSGDSTSGAGMTGDGSADTSSGDSTSGAEASGDGSADASSGASTSGAGVTGDRQADAAPGDSTASTSSEVGPGVRLFAALAGEAPEDVTDPEVFIRALRRLGDGAVEVAQQALRGEEGKAAARARLRALADTFREHGIPIPRGDSETAESTSPAGSAPHTSSS